MGVPLFVLVMLLILVLILGVIIGLLIWLLPALLVAFIVYLISGNELLTAIAFLVIAAIIIYRRKGM